MTKAEITGIRDLTFSVWIRKNLPDSKTGFMVSDLDFILYNYRTRKIELLEIKTHSSQLPKWQKMLFENLAHWLARGIDGGWEFLGFHTIVFENTFFHDGKCFFDGQEISEENLLELLSF